MKIHAYNMLKSILFAAGFPTRQELKDREQAGDSPAGFIQPREYYQFLVEDHIRMLTDICSHAHRLGNTEVVNLFAQLCIRPQQTLCAPEQKEPDDLLYVLDVDKG